VFFSCKLYLSEKTHEIFSIKRKKTFRAFFTAEGLDTCADEPDFRFRKIVLTASSDRNGYLLPFKTDFYRLSETLFLCQVLADSLNLSDKCENLAARNI